MHDVRGFLRLLRGACRSGVLSLPVLVPAVLSAQEHTPSTADMMAGLYFGDPSTLNGPIMHIRYTFPITGPIHVGLRGAFRDDDNSGGRVQSVGFGGEGIFGINNELDGYFLAGFGIVASVIERDPRVGEPDTRSGLAPTLTIGLGAQIGGLLIEARQTEIPGAQFTSLSVGARTYRPGGVGPHRSVSVMTSSFSETRGNYVQSEGFRGYTIVLEQRVHPGSVMGLRGSFGIDFLDFPGGSNGALTVLVGPEITLVSVFDRAIEVAVVPQLGTWLFTEPATRFYPVAQLGGEVHVGVAGLRVVAGVAAAVANGPAGFFSGLHSRGGLRLGL